MIDRLIGGVLSTMLTACLSQSCFNGTYPDSLLPPFGPISLKAAGGSLTLRILPQSYILSTYNSSDPFTLSMPQSLVLAHRFNIPQSPNDATIGNPNRFAPPARAGQFRRFSHLGETSLESRVIRSSCGVVGVIFLASFLILKLTNWLQEKSIYRGLS